jgi:hypothetical protein
VNEVSICYKHPSGVIADLLLEQNLISRYTREIIVNLFVNNILSFCLVFRIFGLNKFCVHGNHLYTINDSGFMKKALMSFCFNTSL